MIGVLSRETGEPRLAPLRRSRLRRYRPLIGWRVWLGLWVLFMAVACWGVRGLTFQEAQTLQALRVKREEQRRKIQRLRVAIERQIVALTRPHRPPSPTVTFDLSLTRPKQPLWAEGW